ncbi:MAG: hypothetical protein KDD63_16345, partial [Bacteroidetes bacterium]|nr:hypothetical protein [Bacteroidota bacterium]
FLFYELQRRFSVHEYLHDAMPVILVANSVPNPDEINEAWLMQHDWILRRAILDDSFLPALEMLKRSKVGLNVEIDTLRAHVQIQMKTFEDTKIELKTFVNARSLVERSLRESVNKSVDALNAAEDDGGILGDVSDALFMPKGILGDLTKVLHGEVFGEGPQAETAEAAEARQNAAEEALARIDRSLGETRTRLAGAASALEQSIQKYTQAMKGRMDRQLAISKLILHVKDNILYYMQAIWDHEPPDQRFLRLMDIEVPTFGKLEAQIERYGEHQVLVKFEKNFDPKGEPRVSLKEIADLDQLLGYKGNYMIFPIREEHPITSFMMQDYLNEYGEVKDPDESLEAVLRGKRGERIWMGLEEKVQKEVIQPQIHRLKETTRKEIVALKRRKYSPEELHEEIYKINKKLEGDITALRNRELNKISELKKEIFGNGKENVVVVPSDLLFIAALPGTNPILEDFKLKHRGLDVLKAAAELEEHQIELIRRKARLLAQDYNDPDIDKNVMVNGASQVIIDAE